MSRGGMGGDGGGLTTLFVRSPRLVVLVLGVVLVAGLAAMQAIGRQEDPTLISRYMLATAVFPGATPERVEALVTYPIEDALSDVEEIKKLNTAARTGYAIVALELKEDVTLVDPVWSRVRDRIRSAVDNMPDGVEDPEYEYASTQADTIVVGLTWTGKGVYSEALMKRLSEDLKDRLSRLPGTKEAKLYGEPDEEITVAYDPRTLAALGLSPMALSDTIAKADSKSPGGTLYGPHASLTVDVDGALDGAERVRSIPIRRGDDDGGGALRVGDVAEVSKGIKDPRTGVAVIDGRRGILVSGVMETGGRVDLWAARARAAVEDFQAGLPPAVWAEILFDQSAYTSARLEDLGINLLIGVGLVMGVLWVMMGWRSAMLVGMALPLTMATVVFLMQSAGVALHQISVSGLIIALGLLIDNAIVSIDEYERGRARGLSPLQAVDALVRHLAVPLLASTLTTVLTFMPIVLLPGATGEFVGSLGLSVVFSVSASLFFAMTVVPACAAYLDRFTRKARGPGPHSGPQGDMPPRPGVGSKRLTALYSRVLGALFRRPVLAMGLASLPALVGFGLAPTLVGQFFPQTDRDQFQVQLSMPVHTPLEQTLAQIEKVDAVLMRYPEIRSSLWMAGDGAPKLYYNTFVTGNHKPSYAAGYVTTESMDATAALLPGLQAELMTEFPEAEVLAVPFEQGPPYDAPIEVEIFGPDLRTLRQLAEQVRALIADSPNVTYTRVTMDGGLPKLSFELEEDEVRLTGYGLDDVAVLLSAQQEGMTGGTVLEGTEELPVRVRATSLDRGSVARLTDTSLPRAGADAVADAGAGGSGVPLNALGHLSLTASVTVIPRAQGERQTKVQAFLMPYSLPSVTLAVVRDRLDKAGLVLPAGYRMAFGGESKESTESLNQLAAQVLPLMVIMMGVVVLAFNSFRHAGVIALVAVMSIGMALLALKVMGYPLGFMAIVGIMGLIGVAINDSIVVLSSLRADPDAARGDRDAVLRVVVEGSRHVISTTLTTVGGFLPLLVSTQKFWPPLATAVAGGLIGATLIALIFVPSIFLLMHRRKPARPAHGERTTDAPAVQQMPS